MNQPLVSVVTPFHNTAPYLAQCIESVLAQSYSKFEYVLVDNCSSDGAGDIAADYARREPRIKLIRLDQPISQVRNYNAALAQISEESLCCKVVQADDSIFPDCLALMVRAFRKSESVGLVSSYYLKGNRVRGSDFPYPSQVLDGKEMARWYLRSGVYVFGSPTTVCYRSSLVRSQQPFFDESLLHEDTEKCMQILTHWDFAFVHQVLSFLRTDNESISSAVRTFAPDALDWHIIVERYASSFLDAQESETLKRKARRKYYQVLSGEALKFRGAAFWQYHRSGLATMGVSLDMPYLIAQIARRMLWLLVNPGTTLEQIVRFGRRKIRERTARPTA